MHPLWNLQAVQAHLNSLEEDHKHLDNQPSDEEFTIESEEGNLQMLCAAEVFYAPGREP